MKNLIEVVRIKQIIEEREGVIANNINSPDVAVEIAQSFIGDEDREVLLVIGLNTKNQVNVINRCHVGTINASFVHPREVFKVLILSNCTSFIIAHNHPSYILEPSNEDVKMTQKLAENGNMMGIPLLDSLIVNESNYYSFKERGYL